VGVLVEPHVVEHEELGLRSDEAGVGDAGAMQIMASVGSDANGSTKAVVGTGTSSMSLSLIACQPRMLEPSKPRPSSKVSSSSLATGIVKCCQAPRKSVNRRSTALTSFSRHKASTSRGFMGLSPGMPHDTPDTRGYPRHRAPPGTT
jgi:hypothetical protein